MPASPNWTVIDYKFSVRRCELHSQSTSPTPSDSPSQNTALKDHFTQQLEALYSFPSPDINGETDVNPPLKAPSNQESKPDPEAFTFRLLAPDPRKNAALDPARTQKILLRSPTPPGQDPGLLPPQHRPLGHYLTAATPSTARQQGEYAAAAVEGHCVMEEARQRWVSRCGYLDIKWIGHMLSRSNLARRIPSLASHYPTRHVTPRKTVG